jgi:hypothetical protein
VIKFVSDLRQVGGFLSVPSVSSTNKTDRHDITIKQTIMKEILCSQCGTNYGYSFTGGKLHYNITFLASATSVEI